MEPQNLTPLEDLAIVPPASSEGDAGDRITAMLEAIVYVADEPLTAEQIADALGEPRPRVAELLRSWWRNTAGAVTASRSRGGRGLQDVHQARAPRGDPRLRQAAPTSTQTFHGGPWRPWRSWPISSPSRRRNPGDPWRPGGGRLEDSAGPEADHDGRAQERRCRPILYKTAKDFLVQFGLKDLSELPTLKEFEELKRMALGEDEAPPPEPAAVSEPAPEQAKG